MPKSPNALQSIEHSGPIELNKNEAVLYIDPQGDKPAEVPIDDALALGMEQALAGQAAGIECHIGHYRQDTNTFIPGVTTQGFHWIPGTSFTSTAADYMLVRRGEDGQNVVVVTNSLAPVYLRYYRKYASESELE